MTTPRRHDIDTLRALAFLVLILYHVGMYYVSGDSWSWLLKSRHSAGWLAWPMEIVNIWRMDLVFLVSGVAVSFLARGLTGAGLLRTRAVRLVIPLVFGMVALVPYQAYAEGVARGTVEPGFWTFLVRYVTLQPWPEEAFTGADVGVTWNHLWYLPYLFAYTAVLALLLGVLRSRWGLRARAAFTGLRGWRLLALPVVPFVLYGLTLAPSFPATMDLIHDWHAHAAYFTIFLYGYWLAADTGVWLELERLRIVALATALVCLGTLIVLHQAGADAWLLRLPRSAYGWTLIAAILGFAHRHLNRPWPWLRWATESVYPWYMLHQTIIIAGAVSLAPLHLGPVAEPAALIAVTVAGCWALTDGPIRRLPWLRPLFGLKPLDRGGPSAPETAHRQASEARVAQ
jgi:glucan biosynthesis protein C